MHLIILVVCLRGKYLFLPAQNCMCKNLIHKIWESLDSVKGTKCDLFRWALVAAMYSACEADRWYLSILLWI